MEIWQILLLTFVALLPFALLVDFFPGRERLNAAGRPLPRDWEPHPSPPAPDEEHH